MIHIDQRQLSIDSKWSALAAKRTADVCSKTTPKERKKYVKKHSSVWANPRVKKELERISNKKCWYCESYDKRSDRHVDHFRPKSSVSEDDSHEGYYWLAFHYKNYRLACTYCNCLRSDRASSEVKGKGDSFPLRNPANRVANHGSSYTQLLRQENAILIDPCSHSDVALLAYREDGRVVERFDKDDKTRQIGYDRANRSIDIYHLNEVEIKEARLALYDKIIELVERGDKHFEHAYQNDASADEAFEDVVNDILDIMGSEAEYSAFAKAMITSLRNRERPWLDSL